MGPSQFALQTVLQRCDELAQVTDEVGKITRSYLSPAMENANARVAAWMASAGMQAERDHAGNLIGELPCSIDNAPVLILGSHLDTVRDAGRYDGILGVLLALAVAESYADSELPFSLEVAAFSDEEGLRFGLPFIGSRAVVGDLDETALACCDEQGVSISQAIRDWGGEPTAISPRYRRRRVLGYVEAHIEQGPRLEHLGQPLGVLASISGSRWSRLRFVGQAGHAGTTPMALRRDALAGAAEWLLEVERHAAERSGLVATVGKLETLPGSGNVIPGAVELNLDIRHPEPACLDQAHKSLLGRARKICQRRQLKLEHELLNRQSGARADSNLSRLLAKAVQATGVSPPSMVIGAGHDAMIMANAMPMTMLMIRSPGGISHHPDESVFAEDVGLALESLCGFVDRVAEIEVSSSHSDSFDVEQQSAAVE